MKKKIKVDSFIFFSKNIINYNKIKKPLKKKKIKLLLRIFYGILSSYQKFICFYKIVKYILSYIIINLK